MDNANKEWKIFEPSTFIDHRGVIMNNPIEQIDNYLYEIDHYAEYIHLDFTEGCISKSNKNVLRGIHSEENSFKLVQCIYGNVQYVIVNCDKTNQYHYGGR